MRRSGAGPVRTLRRGGGRRRGTLQPRLQGRGVYVREMSWYVRCAREVQTHGDLLVARWGCAWARFTGPVGLVLCESAREKRWDGGRTRMDEYGSCLGLENGRLREDRRREGMLGAGRDLCVSRKEEEEEDMVEDEVEVSGHEIVVTVNVVLGWCMTLSLTLVGVHWLRSLLSHTL